MPSFPIYFVGFDKVNAFDRGPFKYYGAALDYQVVNPTMTIFESHVSPTSLEVSDD